MLCYGEEEGYYVAPIGYSYTLSAMLYKIRSYEYNEYKVIREGVIEVERVEVFKGTVAVQPA